jgi:hypothetical protein
MTTTINASTSSGLVNTADTSGILQLQTASTAALTIDASQNVGIGTASPTALTSNKALTINSPTGFGSLVDLKTNETLNLRVYSNASSSGLSLKTATPLVFETNDTERMRIDSSGNVMMGVTSSLGSKLSVSAEMSIGTDGSNRGIFSYSSGAVIFGTISSGTTFFNSATLKDGCFGIGAGTSTPATYGGLVCRKGVAGTWNGVASNAAFTCSDATYSTFTVAHSSANGGSALLSTDAGGRLQMWCSGTGSGGVYLGSGGTSWTSASDERVKDIIEPIENGLTKVASLRAVIGKYKKDEEGTRRSFLIAQDVEAVLPEAVNYSNPDELGLSYTDVIPLLVASIKELKAINDTQAETINALTARIVALETA